MPPKRPIRAVLKESSNNNSNVSRKTQSKQTQNSIRKKTDENQWRTHILAFYMYDKSLSSYIDTNKIGRDPFRTRWEKSGLRELKKRNTSYANAEVQYDFWFCKWRGHFIESKQKNRSKGHKVGFIVHVDDNDNDNNTDDDEDEDDAPTSNGKEKEISNSNNDDDDDDDNDDAPSLEEEENKKKPPTKKKLQDNEMKDILFEYYLRTDAIKLLTFIKVKGRISNKVALFRHWKESGLQDLKLQDAEVVIAFETYDCWCANEKEKTSNKNKKNGSSEKAFPIELEVFIRELIKQLALCGQGLGKKAIRKIIAEALRDGSGNGSFSRSTLNRFFKNYKLECRNVKNIDPTRIAQVTAENRDAFFFRLDQIVKLVHSIDPENCKATCWSEVLAECIYNMDELGTDPTKFRDVLLIPEEILNRIFQATPEGDRPSSHLSVAMFSCSNGKYKDKSANIEGSPMPMMIHSSAEAQDGMSAVEKRLSLYEEQDTIPFDDERFSDGFTIGDRNLGIAIRSSPNGSMTKVLFLDGILHFIKNIPSDQGADGKYSFLLLDSHVSRWNPRALYFLFKNRIIPIFFPSHLSIVVQPQDNGVILFFHKCMEEACQIARLFKSETDISYSNRVMAKALHLFRDGERKKLLSRGSNSTTRSYSITGIKPKNPYSSGWRENLELYSSFNGLQVKSDDRCQYYGVRPKENDICVEFSEADISLLDEAVPNIASDENDNMILQHAKAKCYSIAEEIVNSWVEKGVDERTCCPQATTDVEKVALKHMNITQIISAEPKSEESMLLEVNFEKRKREAMLYLTKKCEQIQVKPKANNNNSKDNRWYYAERMELSSGMWNIFDGQTSLQLTTDDIDKYWEVNIGYNMFPDDKKLQENNWRSGRRRRNEKDDLLKRMAKALAEEERNADLKDHYDLFMEQPKEKQTFVDFKLVLAAKIERPSDHTVIVQLGLEEHIIKVVAHGNNTSSMSQLVMDNVCRVMIGNTNRTEKNKNKKRRGGRVNRVKRGSDGFVKSLQIDQQHIRDLSSQEEIAEKKKKNDIALCKTRLRYIRNFHSMHGYDAIWNDDHTLQLQKLKKKHLTNLLRIFNVKGRAKLLKNDPIKAVLSGLVITQTSINVLKLKLSQTLEEYGEEFDAYDGTLDSSFAGESIADNSIVNDTLILDISFDNPLFNDNTNITLNIEDDESSGSVENFMVLESETSGGEAGSSGNETDNTAKLDKLIEAVRKKKTVTFNETPSTFSQQAATSTSTSSSSSSEDELFRQRPPNKRTTRSSKRWPARKSTRRRPTHITTKVPSPQQRVTRNNGNNDTSRSEASTSHIQRKEDVPPTPTPPLRRSFRHL